MDEQKELEVQHPWECADDCPLCTWTADGEQRWPAPKEERQ